MTKIPSFSVPTNFSNQLRNTYEPIARLGNRSVTYITNNPVTVAITAIVLAVLCYLCLKKQPTAPPPQTPPPSSAKVERTPARVAAEKGDVGKINTLTKADLEVADGSGDTPAHAAAAFGQTDIIKAMAAKGVNLSTLNHEQSTPLHLATRNGKKEAVQALVDAKVSLNEQDEYGDTPLHIAAANGNAEIGQILMDAGAKKDLENNDGATPTKDSAKKPPADVICDIQSGNTDAVKRELKRKLIFDE